MPKVTQKKSFTRSKPKVLEVVKKNVEKNIEPVAEDDVVEKQASVTNEISLSPEDKTEENVMESPVPPGDFVAQQINDLTGKQNGGVSSPFTTESSGISSSHASIFSTPPEEVGSPSKKGKRFLQIFSILCVCAFCLLGGFIGGYFYTKYSTKNIQKSIPNNLKEVKKTIVPTPTIKEVNLSTYRINILNGSGEAGVAGSEQAVLEADGFTVSGTGNSDTQDYTKTVISLKKDIPQEYIDKLKESLSKNYLVSSESGQLDSTSSYDVVITLGSTTP